SLMLCQECKTALLKGNIPALSLANRTFLGPVPDALKDLTVVEEAMIARCRAKCWVIHLRDNDSQSSDRGMRGHIIIYPQRPDYIAQTLPPSLDDIITPICVLFVGASPPSQDWLKTKAQPLIVRKEKVRNALIWLKRHNPHYKNIQIN
ncbi:hypothetical protein GLOTRDRAFT_23200, partial [Gloeophyllum trabeum ATCC 11539]